MSLALALAIAPGALQLSAEVKEAAGTALTIMDTPMGVKAVSMGEAFSAVADDTSTVYWNPAGLTQLAYPTLGLSHNRWFMDANYQNLSAVLPRRALAMGAQLTYVDAGSFERRDEFGARQPGTIEPYQMGGALAAARRFGPWSVGAALKGYREAIADYSISGYAVDAGGICMIGDTRLSLVMRNLGGVKGFRLPLSFCLGGAHVRRAGPVSFLISGDGKFAGTGEPTLKMGTEAGLREVFFLRIGFRLDLSDSSLGDVGKLSGGMGLKYDRFVLDYAFAFYGNLGMTSMASLAVEFRRAATRPEKRFALPPLKETPPAPAPAPPAAPAPAATRQQTAETLFEEAMSCEARGDYWGAATNYVWGLEMDGGNGAAWKRLGLIYYRFAYYAEAKTCMQAVLRLDANDEQARRLLRELTAGEPRSLP